MRSEGRRGQGVGRRERSRCGGQLVAGSQGCGSRWGRNCCPGKLEGREGELKEGRGGEGGEKKGEGRQRGWGKERLKERNCRKEKGEGVGGKEEERVEGERRGRRGEQ